MMTITKQEKMSKEKIKLKRVVEEDYLYLVLGIISLVFFSLGNVTLGYYFYKSSFVNVIVDLKPDFADVRFLDLNETVELNYTIRKYYPEGRNCEYYFVHCILFN